jgi:hypothetical protein
MALEVALILILADPMCSGAATVELPTGFEPVTYALREARDTAPGPLPAPIAERLPRNAPSAQRARGSRATTRATAESALE